ncbi:MAG: 16S rRNA (cytidine(1402)-2'-O)-methyltransferase [Roseinatronobacter sp.]
MQHETNDRAASGTASGSVQTAQIAPGLHLIATPIGAARDITLRALDLLTGADLLVAEDTRSLRHLMEIHGISVAKRPILSYHEHNGAQMRPRVLQALRTGARVVYASEAGTPLVADPGFQLARAAIAENLAVHAAPGPSAVLAALTVSGLPSDRFCFVGFAPTAKGARLKFLAEIAQIPATLILYESPKRINRLLEELCEIMGPERPAALCRELTKRYEEVLRMSLGALCELTAERTLKGEIALVIDRAAQPQTTPERMDEALREGLERLSFKDAVAKVSDELKLPRRQVYQAALALQKDGS